MFDDESEGYEEPDYEPDDEPDYAVARLRDRKIDEAKAVILEQYFSVERSVYYARQIEIGLEKQFFHWITKRALNELAAERSIGSSVERLEHHVAHFYYPIRHRYPRRQIREVIGMIAEFSAPVFTRAVGHHGELLVESAFARTGFHILDQKVREVERVPWTQTGHDLDFLIERDGIRYGVEVKNQLGYIDQTEFGTKLAMCQFWGIRPMFVTRIMPANYVHDVVRAGGFSMMTQNQNYPLLAGEFARRVRERLDLPVAVIERMPDTALTRFRTWHDKSLTR